eukprot:332299-Amphidinium_carterae.1
MACQACSSELCHQSLTHRQHFHAQTPQPVQLKVEVEDAEVAVDSVVGAEVDSKRKSAESTALSLANACCVGYSVIKEE